MRFIKPAIATAISSKRSHLVSLRVPRYSSGPWTQASLFPYHLWAIASGAPDKADGSRGDGRVGVCGLIGRTGEV